MYYYLHTNGDLIYRSVLDDIDRDSSFVRCAWKIDPEDRLTGWRCLTQAWAYGADRRRVRELAQKWGMTNHDALIYALRAKIDLSKEGGSWIAKEESSKGTGPNALEALGNLAAKQMFKYD